MTLEPYKVVRLAEAVPLAQRDRSFRLPGPRPVQAAPHARAVSMALLCTDLEGFTSTVQRLGDARAQALIHIHNQLLRACLRRYRGREATHTGDGILASFDSNAEAIECAIAMQRELGAYTEGHSETPLRARIGLHVGAPLPEEGRLFGSCVILTVRVCAAARAESILVSDELRLLAGIDHGRRWLDHGLFSLKGIDAPLRLHELLWR